MSAELQLLIGVIIMSVGLGTLLTTAFEKWLRGKSFVWWVLLVVMFVFSITTVSVALLQAHLLISALCH